MGWTLDASIPTLDAGEMFATFDGWSADLSAFVVSAAVAVKQEVNKEVTVKQYIDRTLTWHTT